LHYFIADKIIRPIIKNILKTSMLYMASLSILRAREV